ncbi:ABC transporter permease [Comamonas serinivorans]|uniref:ABC transporter permease n=1 Tax=Comamonas serinivorans TaxID=1082851 RepID=A0A1Y0EPF5_9BURK|nr:DUF4198 domain-containing protein [Comamonas serinivorans]ARU05281.1 ABC transporter permease [Comamonas serinivorans]
MTRLSSFRPALLALALTAAAGVAQAHNAWLLPASTVLSKPDWVSVDAAISNSLFVADHAAMRLDKLVVTAPDGRAVKPENLTQLKKRSVFDLNLEQAGTYRISVVNQGLFASWKDAAGQTKRARGSADTLAKDIPADAKELQVTESLGRNESFITVGKPSALKPHGSGLELSFVNPADATDHVQGERTTFVVLLDGQPAPGIDVDITRGNTQWRDKLGERTFKTDAKGQVTIDWPEAGMYWLDAKTSDDKTSLPQAKQRRLSYSATLEVLP